MSSESAQHWQRVATPPNLGPDDIHLWQYSLQAPENQITTLRSFLSREEIARADRLLRPGDRLRFIVGRARLRQLLSDYLDIKPNLLALRTLPQGKPVLAEAELSFNLSHSGELALLAVARTLALGVDLERVRPELDWKPLANRYFSKGEQQALQALQPEQQTEAFFSIWTRKEAWLKAVGSGFQLPFDRIEVSAPPEPAALLSCRQYPAAPDDWQLDDLPIADNYRATLAYPAPQRKLLLLDRAPGSNQPGAAKG